MTNTVEFHLKILSSWSRRWHNCP